MSAAPLPLMPGDLYEALNLTPFDFQIVAREAHHAGESGLLEVPTGSGKTLAAIAGPLERLHLEERGGQRSSGLKILYLTPLRALSRDVERAIRAAVDAMGMSLRVECRTGDVPASRRRRQLETMPEVLITTPESLSVLLSRKGSSALFESLDTVVIDEWHELLSTKRGTQTELAVARLRSLRPAVKCWALSATLANPEEAAGAACGAHSNPRIIRTTLRRPVDIDVVLPPASESIPWAGHLGTRMVPELLKRLDTEVTTLIFTNTRKQAESWFQRLYELAPEQGERIALHHGSIDAGIRREVENRTRSGTIRWVVATSSLDLGIDFEPVELVVQVGSPKSLGRLIQRAGRSNHQPGKRARILFVPTHALELLEIYAAKEALSNSLIEPRVPVEAPLDVLVQHMATLASGDGFTEDELFAEVRTTVGYRRLSRREFDWALAFLSRGGETLSAYDHYRKLAKIDGRWRMRDSKLERLHRASIGTIDGNSMVRVSFTNGRHLGMVEEQFISRIRKGDTFYFSGKLLELVNVRDFTAFVRSGRKASKLTPGWPGGSLPFSPSLARELRLFVSQAALEGSGGPKSLDEITQQILESQRQLSAIPREGELLVEILTTKRANHLFFYPFAGRQVHEGIASLVISRLQSELDGSFSATTNDYGIQIESRRDYPFESILEQGRLFGSEGLTEELPEVANVDELARRAFRPIARIAGLVFPGYPGAQKTVRQLQVSAGLLYDVFTEHEPESLLLRQAHSEVLRSHFGLAELQKSLRRMNEQRPRIVHIRKPSPFSFPLLVEQLTQTKGSLSFEERVARIREQYALA